VKSVTLIAPRAKNRGASDISVLTTPLSGILILATMLHEKGYLVKFFDESFKTPEYENIESDYVLISSMSATVNKGYEIADKIKQNSPKTQIIMGGLHVSFKAEEALQHCDTVVIGEGENVLFDIMDSKYKKSIVKGTSVADLNSIPMPDYSLVEGISKNPNIVSVCSSRGCPFNCKFCSLKNMFGRKYRYISTKKLIEYLKKFKKIKNLCFDEPNFSANKERTIEILKEMKKNNIYPKYAWPSVSIDVAENDELLSLCSDISEFNFLIGLESINIEVLKAYNKKNTPETIRKSIKKLHDYGIKVQGSFIFGSDYDDKSAFKKTVDFCQDTEIDFPGFFPLTPYVGTDIRKELEENNRIFTNNWDYYDGAHVVIYPKNMTPYELQDGVISAFDDFYSTSKTIKHIRKGEFFYSFETLYFRHLIKKIIKENKDYLNYLDNISS